jgi:hypothetical protein
MITKVFTSQLIQSLLGINWFGFTGLFGSACLFVNTSREKSEERKRCDDLYQVVTVLQSGSFKVIFDQFVEELLGSKINRTVIFLWLM